MLGLFNTKPSLDEETIQWLFDTYAWAFRNFGADHFHRETVLVTPTNEHFPGRVDSAEKMAETVFGRVQAFAGMQQWPFKPLPLGHDHGLEEISEIRIAQAPRGPDCRVSVIGATASLPIGYDPEQARKPDRLIALFAQDLAGHLLPTSSEAPPEGAERRDHATDVLAIFLGFGLFLANNAFTLGGGSCSGCGKSPQALGSLMEEEMVYALAIFCALKEIPTAQVLSHLKGKLRPLYKRARKDVARRGERLANLAAIK
jgi:hypothetical protein